MDTAKEMSIFFCGLEFARGGYNTLCLDGPGMGEMRRMRDMPSRYDYEVPGTAAYEYLLRRKDVDPKRIAIMGYSFGGYYSSRIAAFEKRYAACIALSALHWDLAGWRERQAAHARAAQFCDRIGYGRCQRWNAGFAYPAGFFGARHDVHLDPRHLVHAQRAIAVEVALRRTARLDVDLAVVERAQGEADAAFHLRADHIRIDRHAAVDGADHALDLQLAIAHRDFGDLRDESIERLVHGDALRDAGALGLAPARLVGRQLEDRCCTRALAEE